MTLPRAAQLDASSYSARRVIFMWIGLGLAGWAVIFSLVRLLVSAIDFLLA